MPARFFVIASVEDTGYMAWQARLFHYSCLTALGAAPLIFVHGMRETPHPYLVDIVRTGGVVYSAPNYRVREGRRRDYPPRNTAAALIHAAELTDRDDAYFVLCDADMLFVRPPDFAAGLSGDRYDYMSYDDAAVRHAGAVLGVSGEYLQARGDTLRVGVPYVIPARHALALGTRWMDAIDAFVEHSWIDGMHAFGLAAASLELSVAVTRSMVTNGSHDALVDAPMIHYCYGDVRWNKRDFAAADRVADVWEPRDDGAPGSVLAEIARQLRAAREFYEEKR